MFASLTIPRRLFFEKGKMNVSVVRVLVKACVPHDVVGIESRRFQKARKLRFHYAVCAFVIVAVRCAEFFRKTDKTVPDHAVRLTKLFFKRFSLRFRQNPVPVKYARRFLVISRVFHIIQPALGAALHIVHVVVAIVAGIKLAFLSVFFFADLVFGKRLFVLQVVHLTEYVRGTHSSP